MVISWTHLLALLQFLHAEAGRDPVRIVQIIEGRHNIAFVTALLKPSSSRCGRSNQGWRSSVHTSTQYLQYVQCIGYCLMISTTLSMILYSSSLRGTVLERLHIVIMNSIWACPPALRGRRAGFPRTQAQDNRRIKL